ncbi:MAG: hypothetical protein H6739_07570 [Alphaproteobacteria bacterium]|nr:hypothetical protein [Alphaproteobacteria bacterium]
MRVQRLTLGVALALTIASCTSKDPATDDTVINDDSGPVEEIDADNDGYPADEDCDDSNETINPGADERCDGVDNNCDGVVDEDAAIDAQTWYGDNDGDGYGVDEEAVVSCDQPTGYADAAGDCDDEDAAFHPGAVEDDCADPNDYNCDGSVGFADNDGDGWPACQECDDGDEAVNPDATEICDEIDNNCDGSTDEGVTNTYYADVDGDGYGDPDFPVEACEAPVGYVGDSTDCDDTVAAVNPGATELCNSVDDDCDGSTDEDDADDASTWYADSDADGYGDASTTAVSCSQPSGYVADSTDCDDSASAVNPAATELCNSVDDDCDGSTDEDDADDASTWYADSDADGYGDPSNATASCNQPSGYVSDDSDCDDGSSAVNPSATELCNSVDDDCDGTTDEDDADDASTWYADSDADGYGDASSTTASCSQPSGYVSDSSDCDDASSAVNPAATEYCNSVDDDCDGTTDEDDAADASTWYADSDADTYGDALSTTAACSQPSGYVSDNTDCDDADAASNPSATETCDAADNDCDIAVDEGVLGTGASCPATDCVEILADNSAAADGTYVLDAGSFFCDMTTDGGGWTEVGSNVAVWGTSYDTTYYNSQGFTWDEVLFAYDSGSVHAHCTYPDSLTGCNNLGFQFASENWGVPQNWGSSICGMSTTDYTSATSYIGGYDFVIGRTSSTDTIRIGALEAISNCTIGDNPGTAYLDILVRR